MTASNENAALYNAYCARGGSTLYERTPERLDFFGRIAERLVCDLHPRTALDVGCAMGFLVEALRDRSVEAYGVDVSAQAISRVREDLRPFCWVGSILDPFPRRYDLVICIEVLEHLSSGDGRRVLGNLCQAADDILFSSAPFDYREATHFNVQPPEYWAEQFALHGFVRDVDYDASYITPWAVRVRRTRDPWTRVVRDYERRFWLMWKENTDLRRLTAEMRQRLETGEQTVQALEDRITQHEAQFAHLQQQAREAQALQAQLAEITGRPSWKLIQLLQMANRVLAPPGTLRARALDLGVRTLTRLRPSGWEALVRDALSLARRVLDKGWRMTGLAGDVDAYQAWMAAHEPGPAELDRQRREADRFAYQPLISILTPVYNPQHAVLQDTIASVRAQTYPHWELCLADGGSTAAGVHDVLTAAAKQDRRIRVRLLENNQGISGNSNVALGMAQGEFILLLDHDDLLSPDTLYAVVQQLNQTPEADLIYFDEDKVSEDGRLRHEPWFKPGHWSPDMLLSVNYLMHSIIRRDLLVQAGGFDPAMDGAQDWDVALRLTERTQNIFHIPRVFYHWRQVKGSAARDANAKPWAFEAQARCLTAHLKRRGAGQAQVVFPSLGQVRVLWPTSGARVSIIIPTKDNVAILRACLTSIRQLTASPNYEIVLVDTGSVQPETQQYYAELAGDARVRLVRCAGPFNFSKANNFGAAYASSDLLLFLNNDTQVLTADWLDELVGWAEQPGVGAVGAKLVRPDGTIQHAGIIMGLAGHGSHIFDGGPENVYGPFGSSEWYRDYQAVTGACLMLRREVFEQVGRFDEAYQVGYGDIDLCLRVRARGQRVVYTPFARLLHLEGGTRGFSQPPSDVLRASCLMLPAIQGGDPYFNPNLSYTDRRPAIVRPGEIGRAEHLGQILADFGLVQHPTGPLISPALMERLPTLAEGDGAADPGGAGRLLLVTHDLSLSGAPLILFLLAEHLLASGYRLTVLSPLDGPLHERYTRKGVPIVIERAALDDARVTAVLLPECDLVLVNSIVAWRAVYAARAFQKPCLWWIHESRFGQEYAGRIPWVGRAFSVADRVIFPSSATAAQYAAYLAADNFLSLHTGFDVELTAGPADGIPNRDPHKLCVVCLGSLEYRKGQDVLLRAVAALPLRVREQMQFYLVGRILDRSFYRQLETAARRLSDVWLVGQVPHQQARAYLQAADIVVSASRDEALPIVLIEAMAYGKSIVATRVGGVPEVIEQGISGLLVPAEDHRALAQALEFLHRDWQLAERLGRGARATYAKRLTMERFGPVMLRVIERTRQAG